MAEHDQRFKTLIREFVLEFISLFFPAVAALLDLRRLSWQDKEVFVDRPRGAVYLLDLVARVPTLTGVINVLHIEVESRDAVATFRPRAYNYFTSLRQEHQCPVITLAVYLRVGLKGIGIDSYVEVDETGLEVVRFQFRYVGLPRLKAATYVAGDNWLGVALSALMNIRRGRKAWLRAEALRRLLFECPENNYRRMLLVECVEAYLDLDEAQQRQYERLLLRNPYKEIGPMMQTTFEKGMEKGLRLAVEKQLIKRFGPLPEAAQQKLAGMASEKLDELLLAILDAKTLRSLGLVD